MRLRGCDPDAFHPMASPIAHSFAGFWTFMLLTARLKVRLATACRQYLQMVELTHKPLPSLSKMKIVYFFFYELITLGASTPSLLALWVQKKKSRATPPNRKTARPAF